MSPILDQSPDTNTGTTSPVVATATMDRTDPNLMAEPEPAGYHAATFDLSPPYRGASRVIVSRLESGDTVVVGPVFPGEYDIDPTAFLAPLVHTTSASLSDALAGIGYATK